MKEELTNAYKELFTCTYTEEEFKKVAQAIDFFDEYSVEEKVGGSAKRSYKYYKVTPLITSSEVKHWLSTVVFARIMCEEVEASLRSKRDKEDELQFLQTLQTINYDSGYGWQELYGVIVFDDNSWLERYEYDGSEHWVKCSTPLEENWFEQ